jgi:hypothetical protein
MIKKQPVVWGIEITRIVEIRTAQKDIGILAQSEPPMGICSTDQG